MQCIVTVASKSAVSMICIQLPAALRIRALSAEKIADNLWLDVKSRDYRLRTLVMLLPFHLNLNGLYNSNALSPPCKW
jgi:hypothetical protein